MIISSFFSGSLKAQDDNETDTSKVNLTIDDLYIDFSPSDLSAFTLLSVTGSEISRPTTTNELTAEILTLTSNAPNLPSGVAIEWSPWHTFVDGKINVQNYRKKPLLSGLQISFATTSDSMETKMAWGLKWSFSKSDPLHDKNYQKAIIDEQKKLRYEFPLNANVRKKISDQVNSLIILLIQNYDTSYNFGEVSNILLNDGFFDLDISNKVDENGVTDGNTLVYPTIPDYNVLEKNLLEYLKSLTNNKFDMETIDSDKNEVQLFIYREFKELMYEYIDLLIRLENYSKVDNQSINKLISDFSKKNWNKFGLDIGFGQVFNSEDHTWSNLEGNTLATYISASIPLPTKSWDQDGKYGLNLNPTIQINKSISADSGSISDKILTGGRLTFGKKNYRLSAEGVYIYNKIIDEDFEDIKRLTLGIELKAFNGTWFELAIGLDDFISNPQNSSIFSLAKVKYSFNNERRLGL